MTCSSQPRMPDTPCRADRSRQRAARASKGAGAAAVAIARRADGGGAEHLAEAAARVSSGRVAAKVSSGRRAARARAGIGYLRGRVASGSRGRGGDRRVRRAERRDFRDGSIGVSTVLT